MLWVWNLAARSFRTALSDIPPGLLGGGRGGATSARNASDNDQPVLLGSRSTRLGALCFLVVVALTVARVVGTWTVFNHTVDEPAHIAAGTQILEKGRVEGDIVQAPLARLAVALGPQLLWSHDPSRACRIAQEDRILQCRGDAYWRTIAAARAGTLPFLVLLLTVVWLWGTRSGGPLVGVLAVVLVANAPPVLAHAGLATTDIGAAGTLTLALFTLSLWLQRPSPGRAVSAGGAAAFAVATKLSAAVFLPAAGLALTAATLLARGRRAPLRALRPARVLGHGLIGLVAFFLVAWAAYGFTLGPIAVPERPEGSILERGIYPLSELIHGLMALGSLNAEGVSSYFLGEIRGDGWWMFFPVLFVAKTPIPFLILFVAGVVWAVRRDEREKMLPHLLAILVILGLAMTSRINLGLRHVLSLYPLAAIAAALGAAALLRHPAPWVRALPSAAFLWLTIDVARAHPDYLPYFNLIAREDAAFFSADSDLDWGQDTQRLAEELQRRGIRRVSVALQSSLKVGQVAPVETLELWPREPRSGWIAVGIGRLLNDRIRQPYLGLRWLACRRPAAVIGKTILLYYVRPGSAPERAGTSCRERPTLPD